MNKKIKYLFGLLITPLLCLGVSFGVAPGFTDPAYELSILSNGTLSNSNSTIQGISSDIPFCISFYNGTASDIDNTSNFSIRACGYNKYNPNQHQCSLPMSQNIYFSVGTDSRIFCYDPTSWTISMSDFVMTSISLEASFGNYSLTSVDYNIYNIDSYAGSDCSSVESDLNTCLSKYNTLQSSYNTLSGNYATCQSNLASCQASNCDTQLSQCLIDNDTLSGNLNNCIQDKNSLQNANDSLTLQLQECLGQSCSGSGDSGTGLYFNQYNLFWSDELVDYSLPITNNLFLPDGYKGKLNEDNVLTIAKINTLEAAYQFSEEDKVTIIDIVSIIVLFLLSTGIIILVILFLKRLVLKK